MSEPAVASSPTSADVDAADRITTHQRLSPTASPVHASGSSQKSPGPRISNRLHGRIKWSAADLVVVAEFLGVSVTDLLPARSGDGWVPAPYVPGTQKAPVPSGTEASALVAGT